MCLHRHGPPRPLALILRNLVRVLRVEKEFLRRLAAFSCIFSFVFGCILNAPVLASAAKHETASHGAASHTTPRNDDDPNVKTVLMRLIVDEVRDIDLSHSTYEVVAEVLQQWQDDGAMRTALHNPDHKVVLTGDQLTAIKDAVLLPEFFIANAEATRETMVRSIVFYPDGTVDLFEKFATKINLDADMHAYPFGTLDLHMEVEAFTDDLSGLRFVADAFELGHGGHGAEAVGGHGVVKGNWTALAHYAQENEMTSMNLGGHDKFSNISYHIEIEHDFQDILQKVIAPLLVTILLSLSINHFCSLQFGANADWRIGGQITLILTIFALKFSLGDDVPKAHFLTAIDALMIAASLIVSAALMAGIFLNNAFQRAWPSAPALEARWNVLLPLLTAGILTWVGSFVW